MNLPGSLTPPEITTRAGDVVPFRPRDLAGETFI